MMGGPDFNKTFNFNEMTLNLCREADIFAQGHAALLFDRVSLQSPTRRPHFEDLRLTIQTYLWRLQRI
jgi:hypothetical protein